MTTLVVVLEDTSEEAEKLPRSALQEADGLPPRADLELPRPAGALKDPIKDFDML